MERNLESMVASTFTFAVSGTVCVAELVSGPIDWYGLASFVSAISALVAAIFSGLAHYRIGTVQADVTTAKDDIRRVEIATNSMKDQLVLTTRSEAHAAGVLEEKEREKGV
jgi:hypothetical protein